MNRRQYLARTGAAGTSVGILTGLAGCLDDLGGSSETNDAEGGDAGSRTGERALDRAAGRLNEAAQPLNELGNLEDPEAVEFDPEASRTGIADARDHLETAESELGDDRQADIDTLRAYADALEGLVAVTATVTDEGITEDIDEVTAAIETEGDIEGASETVGQRHTEMADARERWDEANATIQDLGGDRLNDLAGIDIADLEEGAAALGDVVTSLETLAAAYDATLDPDEGYGALQQGRDDFENGAYEDAQAAFETAESTFSTARQRLEDGTADAPDGLAGHFETAECQTRHLRDAAAAFTESAGAAADGDAVTAKRRQDDGETALDNVGTCTN
ncbi:hypothetical protein [Natrinema versiforme]|uniref:Uncharacterized protein n=1 Tax=Natrinema versiforme JCM 10478 TaxID=1227496 RepID=L9XX66_9EURY|nr:hypothetical protein [Natrinema versiforme]ELY65208.1 hypothetical protein C489_15547 [Natrinema versiforme JCM 10478]